MRSWLFNTGIISLWAISVVSIHVGDTTLTSSDFVVNRPALITPPLVVERCRRSTNDNDGDGSRCVGAHLVISNIINSQSRSIGVDVSMRSLWYHLLSHLVDIISASSEAHTDENYDAESAALYKRSLSDDHQSPNFDSRTSTLSLADADGSLRVLGGPEAETLAQPLHSFILSFTMIMVSEVGDKTFLIAALMAMKHERVTVFSAAFGALTVMTVLSAVIGHALPHLISPHLSHLLASILFYFFGFRLLQEGLAMSSDDTPSSEMEEVEKEIAEKEHGSGWHPAAGSSLDNALEMGLELDIHRQQGPPFHLPETAASVLYTHTDNNMGHGLDNLLSFVLSPAWVQTFLMTFLGEWGDRSQIATIAMAAGQDYWWVIFGALMGHALCTGIAVVGGRAIAGQVSLKIVTITGAVAFLIFGCVYLLESLSS